MGTFDSIADKVLQIAEQRARLYQQNCTLEREKICLLDFAGTLITCATRAQLRGRTDKGLDLIEAAGEVLSYTNANLPEGRGIPSGFDDDGSSLSAHSWLARLMVVLSCNMGVCETALVGTGKYLLGTLQSLLGECSEGIAQNNVEASTELLKRIAQLMVEYRSCCEEQSLPFVGMGKKARV